MDTSISVGPRLDSKLECIRTEVSQTREVVEEKVGNRETEVTGFDEGGWLGADRR